MNYRGAIIEVTSDLYYPFRVKSDICQFRTMAEAQNRVDRILDERSIWTIKNGGVSPMPPCNPLVGY